MPTVSEIISGQLGNALSNVQTWGGIIYNVKAFGARGNGIADDTADIQETINTAISNGGGVVYFPPGVYVITGTLTVTSSCILEGGGRGFTQISYQGPDDDAIEITANYCEVNNLELIRSGTPSSGAGVKVDNAALLCTFDNITISGFFYGMDFTAASSWNLSDSYIFNNIQYGLYVRNTILPDSGDQVIQGCTFDSSIGTPAAIRHESGGGIKIYGNKILRHGIGYDLQVADGAITSIAIIDGNSIEMQTVRHIRLGRLGTTGVYSFVTISDNQHNFMSSITEGYLIGDGIDSVTVTGNVTHGFNTATYINIAGGSDINIDSNTINEWQKGVVIGSTINGVTIGPNAYKQVSKPVENNTTLSITRPPLIYHEYINKFTNVTSDTVYTNLFRLDMLTFRAAKVELVFEGILAGVSAIGRNINQIAIRNAGNITQTSINDTNAGAVFDVQFDNATTPGSTIIGIKRNTPAGGTALNGTLTIVVTGSIQGMNIL